MISWGNMTRWADKLANSACNSGVELLFTLFIAAQQVPAVNVLKKET